MARLRSAAVVVLLLTATSVVLSITPASAFPGSLALPFPEGETWYVCQGYQSSFTHTYSYALDLTAGAPCNKTAATDKQALAPASGTVFRYEPKTGTLCMNMSGGGSVVVTHIY